MAINEETGEITGVRPITDTLRLIGGGFFLNNASDRFAELVTAVEHSGRSGSITLKITLSRATRGGAMLVRGDLSSALPKEDPQECMMFATPDGNLVQDDPKQMRLDIKIVQGATELDMKKLKEV